MSLGSKAICEAFDFQHKTDKVRTWRRVCACPGFEHDGPKKEAMDEENSWNTGCWLACAQYLRLKCDGGLWRKLSTNKKLVLTPSANGHSVDKIWELAKTFYRYCEVEAEMKGATSHVGRKGFANMCSRLKIPFSASVCWHGTSFGNWTKSYQTGAIVADTVAWNSSTSR